jgi:DNA-directed RNA polymerase alpha subunit
MNPKDRDDLRFGDVIECLHLSTGTTNALLRSRIGTIDALCAQTRSSLMKIEGIATGSVEHIRAALANRCGRALTGDRDDPQKIERRHREFIAYLTEHNIEL